MNPWLEGATKLLLETSYKTISLDGFLVDATKHFQKNNSNFLKISQKIEREETFPNLIYEVVLPKWWKLRRTEREK